MRILDGTKYVKQHAPMTRWRTLRAIPFKRY